MNIKLKEQLIEWAEEYNNPKYFQEDPIAFPRHFNDMLLRGEARIEDVEIAAIFAAHFAWGRRSMIVRDCNRLFDEMDWKPFEYIMAGDYRDEDKSIHRTIKWCDVANICRRLKNIYSEDGYLGEDNSEKSAFNANSRKGYSMSPLEKMTNMEIRTLVFGQKVDKQAPNKKINMMKRWLVRNDGKVDFGIWKNSDPAELKIPLDVHVHRIALETGLTERSSKNIKTVDEITENLAKIFPGDPCKGDFALFGYGVTHQ